MKSHFNWFEFQESATEQNYHFDSSQFLSKISECGFQQHELELARQSYDAYQASEGAYELQRRTEDSMNGYIVTDSEVDNVDNNLEFDPSTEKGKAVISQKRAAIRQ